MNRETYLRLRGDVPDRVIAARAGIGEGHLSRISHGKIVPTIIVARRVAVALGSTVDALWPAEPDSAPTNPPKTRRLRAIKGGAPARPPKREAPTSAADAGRAGGLARADRLSAAELSAQGTHAALARWRRVPQSERARWLAAACRHASANDGHAYRSAA